MTSKAFRLTCDVKNPNPDRRFKNDWRYAPVWEKGTVFYQYEEIIESKNGDRKVPGIYAGGYLHQNQLSHSEIYKALVPNLVPIPDEEKDLDIILRECGGYATGNTAYMILDQMLREKRTSCEEIKKLHQNWQDFMNNSEE